MSLQFTEGVSDQQVFIDSAQLPDQLVFINPKQLQQFIYSSIHSVFSALIAPKVPPQPVPKVWRTREYVMQHLHITAPTLAKHTSSGKLKCKYFGRRVLYDDAQLALDNPALQVLLKKKRGEFIAA